MVVLQKCCTKLEKKKRLFLEKRKDDIDKHYCSNYSQNESNIALMLHIGLVNYLRISNLQKLFHTLPYFAIFCKNRRKLKKNDFKKKNRISTCVLTRFCLHSETSIWMSFCFLRARDGTRKT